MTPGEVAAVVAAVALGLGVIGLLLALGAMMRTMAEMRRTVEDFHRSALPLLDDVHAAVHQASSELVKADVILERANTISATVDSTSRLAHRAFSTPVIKVLAFATGSARAFKSLRRKG